jgi:hypothetical protein
MSEQKKKKFLSLVDIEQAPDVTYDEIGVWGGEVRVGSICADDMIEFAEANEDKAKKKRAGLNLIARSLVDADGARIGCEPDGRTPQAALVAKLGKKDSGSIGKVVDAILKLNGMDRKSQEDAKKG